MRGSTISSVLSLASLAVFGLASTAQAELLNVQFPGNFSYACGSSMSCSSATQSGAAFIGSAGDVWNAFPAASGNNPLVNSTGAASAVSISYSTGSSPGTYVDGSNPNNFYGTAYANLYGGYLYSTTSITLTLSGLSANQAFNLYTYTEQDGKNQAGRSMSVNVNGSTATDTQSGAGTFIAGDTYLMFAGLADSSGKVNIAISTLNGESDLNGLQLQTIAATSATPIPEPASILLLGGLAGLALRRRTARAA